MWPLVANVVAGALQPEHLQTTGFQAPPPSNPATTALVAIGALALIGGVLYVVLKDRR